jgi:hypothetical protein
MANVAAIRTTVAVHVRGSEEKLRLADTTKTLVLGGYKLIVNNTNICLTRTPGEARVIGMSCFELSDVEAKVLRDTLNELWPKEEK